MTHTVLELRIPRLSDAQLAKRPTLDENHFRTNREKLGKDLNVGEFLIAVARPGIPDLCHPQNSNFFYLTGLNVPDSVCIIGKGLDGNLEYNLLLPDFGNVERQWFYSKLPMQLKAIETTANVLAYNGDADFQAKLEAILTADDSLSRVLMAEDAKDSPNLRNERLCRIIADVALNCKKSIHCEDARDIMVKLRRQKSPNELLVLGTLAANVCEIFNSCLSQVGDFLDQRDVLAFFAAARRCMDIDGIGEVFCYSSQPGSNIQMHAGLFPCNAGRSFSSPLGGAINRDSTLIIDSNSSFSLEHLNCDVTRTVVPSGSFDAHQLQLYNSILSLYREIIDSVEVGKTSFYDLEMCYREGIRKLLLSNRILSDASTEAISALCPHNIGHFLGLDFHDIHLRGQRSFEQPFQHGDVICLEPAIYINQVVAAELGINETWQADVRIEDTFVVTSDGLENLTARIPVEAEALARLINNR